MIDFLCGELVEVRESGLVLQVGGIGYAVLCTNPGAFSGRSGEVKLFTHLHVREDEWLLYGFATVQERSLFRLLLEVGGIGPKIALTGVGAGTEQVIRAILFEDTGFLTRLPGVGKKTAQRLILELKEKVAALSTGRGAEGVQVSAAPLPPPTPSPMGDALEALQTLGYREEEAKRMLSAVPDAAKMGTEDLIKAALKQR